MIIPEVQPWGVRNWEALDFLGICQQLGFAPGAGETNKTKVRRYMEEIWNQGNLAVIDELFAEDSVIHGPCLPSVRGREGQRQFVAASRAGSPDVHFTIGEMVAEGDKVAMSWSSRQTHRGEFLGVAPTGREFTSNGTSASGLPMA
jgi:predicted ester cyclase